MTISEGEFMFFRYASQKSNIFFDIGCRYDIFYVDMSDRKTFYLFEPNPEYYAICKRKLEATKMNNYVTLENFGLGNKTEVRTYWEHTSSFFDRNVPNYYKMGTKVLPIKRFTEYIVENNIERIDFLKMDVEGSEPDILLDNPEFLIEKVSFVQFEWATTWEAREDKVGLYDIFSVYDKYFKLLVLFNSEHPFSEKVPNMFAVIPSKKEIDELYKLYVSQNYGFEMAMISRRVE